jgi:hypothetical protein
MPKYEFDLDSKAFEGGLRTTLTRIEQGVRSEEERMADLVVRRADVPVLSGELKASGVAVGNQFGWTVPYAGYVEYGTEDTPAFAFARKGERRAAQELRSPI